MTNPTMPPPHVMEALCHIDWYQISKLKTTHHLRECASHPVKSSAASHGSGHTSSAPIVK